MIVFDITKYKTFESVQKWYEELKQYADDGIIVMLVGNKTDLKKLREVKREDALIFSEQNNMALIETSALDSTNVDEAFQQLV